MHLIERSKRRLSARRRRGVASAVVATSALVASLAAGVAQAGAEQAEPVPMGIVGGWKVTGHQALPGGGATTFHYERDPSEAAGWDDAELQWHRSSAAAVGAHLEAQGLRADGNVPTVVWDQRTVEAVFQGGELEEAPHMATYGTAQAYAAPPSPSGIDSFYGTNVKLENVKTELPDGQLVYETRSISRPAGCTPLDFTSPLPVITRDGDRVTVSFERPPPAPGRPAER
jgi:hypothetical protein